MRTGRWRHELGAYRIGDRRANDPIDFLDRVIAQRPPHHLAHRFELSGAACAHQCDADTGLIERPPQRQVHHALAKIIACEAIQHLDGTKVLAKPWRLELGIGIALIIARKASVWPHAPAQQATAKGSIHQRRYTVPEAVGQHFLVRFALEEIVRRLHRVNRRNAAKLAHLLEGEIADPDSADLSLLIKGEHGFGALLDRAQWVGPMNLVDVYMVRAQSSQRLLNLGEDSFAAGIAKWLPVAPIQPSLSGDHDAISQSAIGQCFADDLLRAAETVNWGSIDKRDSALDRRVNGLDRFGLVRTTPHPSADRPCS